MEGIIMKALSGFYYVDDGQTVTACRGRGKLRHQKVTPWWGTGRVHPLGDGSGSLDRILPRKNQFYRPAVANIRPAGHHRLPGHPGHRPVPH